MFPILRNSLICCQRLEGRTTTSTCPWWPHLVHDVNQDPSSAELGLALEVLMLHDSHDPCMIVVIVHGYDRWADLDTNSNKWQPALNILACFLRLSLLTLRFSSQFLVLTKPANVWTSTKGRALNALILENYPECFSPQVIVSFSKAINLSCQVVLIHLLKAEVCSPAPCLWNQFWPMQMHVFWKEADMQSQQNVALQKQQIGRKQRGKRERWCVIRLVVDHRI